MTTWADLFRPGDATDFFQPPPAQPFNAGSRQYDPANAQWLAELCRLVYRDNDDRRDFLARAGLEELKFIRGGADTQAYLVRARSGQWAALVFRGTSSPMDFVIDTGFLLWPWTKGGFVHHGFRRAIRAVWNDELLRALNELECPLYYSGHSLGAALATLAASLRPATAVYTFGSPFVGTRGFTATVSGTPIFRVVDHDDLVARVPLPIRLLLPYVHVGELHPLTHVPEESHGHTADSLIKCLKARSLTSLQATLPGPPDPLADHAPINYVRRIS